MKNAVVVPGYTVISVRHKPGNTSAVVTWWIAKTDSPTAISVTGIPVYVRLDCLKRIFSLCGKIKTVQLRSCDETVDQSEDHLPQPHTSLGYQCATIEFKGPHAVKSALSMKYDGDYTVCEGDAKLPPMTEVWKADLKESYDVNTMKLLADCTKYMEDYDRRKTTEEKANLKLADEPDEEGWTTVTRNKFSRPPKAVKAHELKKLKKKQEKTAILHFYKNQIADSKMQRIRDLKTKFEEDKKRIQDMRQQRKFKPY